MKLLSMKIDGQNRAGILVGNEVLDLTDFFEILESKGEWIEAGANRTQFQHIEGAYRDAIDLCRHGSKWLTGIISKLDCTPTLVDELRTTGALSPLSSVKLNPPVAAPGKILAVGLNYAAHAAEQNISPPEFPLIFSKCVTALAGAADEIKLPRISDMIDYEAELAVVIGKEAKSVSADHAMEHVAGYTIMNDVTARDLQKRERQWVRGKGLDTFAPCGPWLVTTDEITDPHSLGIELRVNGELRQRSNTNDLIFKVPQLIEFISQDLTLKPGDIITTGTPSGVGVFMKPPVFLKDGDEIVISIEGIGNLKNRARMASRA
ncbi:MAG TPA: fumarylacetoacetate hydrolase family protein [Blastocatellia bacterium]|nr:fumarylacetoacetate hydrolase family protein [Blastocatellia bacterium]